MREIGSWRSIAAPSGIRLMADRFGDSFRSGIRLAGLNPKGCAGPYPAKPFENGWAGFALERYLGHSAESVTDRYYVAAEGEELVELLRKQVTARVDEGMDGTEVEEGALPDNVVVFPNQAG